MPQEKEVWVVFYKPNNAICSMTVGSKEDVQKLMDGVLKNQVVGCKKVTWRETDPFDLLPNYKV